MKNDTDIIALRPTMRSVAVKTAEQQAQAMLFRTRDLLVGQRTQLIKALRGHFAEHGIVLGKAIGNIDRLATRLEEDEDIPALVRDMRRLYLDRIAGLSAEIDKLDPTQSAYVEPRSGVRVSFGRKRFFSGSSPHSAGRVIGAGTGQ